MKKLDIIMRTGICAILSVALGFTSNAQITVTTNQTANQLAGLLVGTGVTYSNATLYCATGANGKFTNVNTTLVGIDSGIVLTSGNASGISGPASGWVSATTNTGPDADLQVLAGTTTYDVCRLEFDFVPAGDTVKFDYIFASEEHPGFWCQGVNDAFGFFISGTGIVGTPNIALVPGTNIPVTINSVNGSTNPGTACTSIGVGSPFTQYYTNNSGSNSIAYNGMTHLFTAISAVVPCSTYHLKIAICDGGDTIYDSGVFLKQGSLSSTPIVVNSQGGSTNGVQTLTVPHPYAVRNCLSGSFKFSRPVATPLPQTIHFNIGGSAVNGSDYSFIADSVTILANQTTANVVINPLSPPAGTDSVILYILNNNVCNGQNSIVDSVKLWIYDSLQAHIITNDTTICPGQSVQIMTFGDTMLSYSWMPTTYLNNANAKNPVSTPTGTITYTLTASLPNTTCPAVHDNVTISIQQAPLGPTSNSPVCAGQTINIYGPTMTNATYYWTGPNGFTSTQQNPTIVGASTINAGYYQVVVTVNGCTFPAVGVNIVVNNPPYVTAGSNSPVCVGNALNLTCNVPNVTYAWTGPNGFTSTAQNPTIPAVTTANAGLYSVTVTQNGCIAAPATTFVVVNTLGTTPIPGSNSPVCVGATLNLTATQVNGATYNWSGPNGFTSTLQNPSIPGITLAGAGAYSVTATVNGCASTPASVNVAVTPTPTISNTTFTNPTGCNSNTGTITLNGLVTGSSYNIVYSKNGSPITLNNVVASGGSITITGLGSGSYTNFNISLNGCTGVFAGPITLVDPLAPPSPVAGSNSPVCAGQNINLTATNVTGAIYQWTGPNNYSANGQNQTITGATPTQSGSYAVVANVNGCLSQPSIVNVIVDPVPVTPTAASNTPVCSGNSLNLTATTTTPGVSWSWTGPNTFSSSLQNPTIGSATTAATGTYTVVASVGLCNSLPATTNVIVNPTPVITATSANPSICGGADGSITLNGLSAGNFTINYTKNSAPQPAISQVSSGGSVILSNLTAGSYTNITVSYNGCPSNVVGPIVLVDPNAPASPLATNSSPACEGTNVTLNASTIAGATYIWTGPNGFSDTVQIATVSNILLIGAGVYSVVANVNGCNSLPATTTVVVDPAPAPPIATSNSPVCQDFNIQLSGTTSVVGATYSWVGPNGFTSTSANPSISNAQPVDGGNYILTITSGSSLCTSLPDTAYVIVHPTPGLPTVMSPLEMCQFEQVQLTAQGQNLQWYTQAVGGTPSTSVTPPSNVATTMSYWVSQTINGCEGPREQLDIIVKPQPLPPIATQNYNYCEGDPNPTQLTATGNNLQWYDVATGGTSLTTAPTPITNVPGIFHFYVTQTVNSCESPRTDITITVNPRPGVPMVEPMTLCQGDSVPAFNVQGQNLLWYGEATGGAGTTTPPQINTSDTGTQDYYVSQTVNGCEGDRSLIQVVVNPKVEADLIATPDKACVGKPVTVSFTGSGPNTANYIWDFNGASQVTGTGSGPYTVVWSTPGDKTVSVTISNLNCSASATMVVDISATPDAHFDMKPDLCVNEVLRVQADYDMAFDPTYTWDFAGAQVLEGSGLGPYSIKWNTTGQKVVSLTLTGINCPSEPYYDSVNIHYPEASVASVSSDDICTADSVLFTATPGLDYSYQWSPAIFFGKGAESTGLSAWGKVRSNGYVWLTVTDRWGCSATDSVLMSTKSCCEVFLPNVFSPNADGKNDVFRIVTKGHQTIKRFIIMNRWGKIVFDTANQYEAWDGTFNGEPQDIGTYQYYLKYECADNGELIEMKGDVTLVR